MSIPKDMQVTGDWLADALKEEADKKELPPDLLTVAQMAERSGMAIATIRRKCQMGYLTAYRVGGQWIIPADQVPRDRRRHGGSHNG